MHTEPASGDNAKTIATKAGIGWLSKRPPEFIVLLACMLIGFGIVVWFGVTQFPQHINIVMSAIQSINDKNNEANKVRDVRHAETIKALKESFADGLREYRDQCKSEHDRLERLLQGRKVAESDSSEKHSVATP